MMEAQEKERFEVTDESSAEWVHGKAGRESGRAPAGRRTV